MMSHKEMAEFIAELFEPLSISERRRLWPELKQKVPPELAALFLDAYSNMTKRCMYPPGTVLVPKRDLRVMVAKTMMRNVDIDASYSFNGSTEERNAKLPVTVVWSSPVSHLRGVLFASGEFDDGTLMGYATLDSINWSMTERT